MNWTGGNLHRNSKQNKSAKLTRQKQHFARIRQQLQEPLDITRSDCHAFRPDWLDTPFVIGDGDGMGRSWKRLREGKTLRQKTLEEFTSTAPLARRLASISKSSHSSGDNLRHKSIRHQSENAAPPSNDGRDVPTPMNRCKQPNRLETSRKKLLEQDDWAGLTVARPAQLHFISRADKDKIGKRRKRTSRGKTTNYSLRRFAPLQFLGSNTHDYHEQGGMLAAAESISVRIGKDALVSQTTALDQGYFITAQGRGTSIRKASSDFMLFDDETNIEPNDEYRDKSLQVVRGANPGCGNEGAENMRLNNRLEHSWQKESAKDSMLGDDEVDRLLANLIDQQDSNHNCDTSTEIVAGDDYEQEAQANNILPHTSRPLFHTPTPLPDEHPLALAHNPKTLIELSSDSLSSDGDSERYSGGRNGYVERPYPTTLVQQRQRHENHDKFIGAETEDSLLLRSMAKCHSTGSNHSLAGRVQSNDDDQEMMNAAWKLHLSVSDPHPHPIDKKPKHSHDGCTESRGLANTINTEPQGHARSWSSEVNDTWLRFVFDGAESRTPSSRPPASERNVPVTEPIQSPTSSLNIWGNDYSASSKHVQTTLETTASSHAFPDWDLPVCFQKRKSLSSNLAASDASLQFRVDKVYDQLVCSPSPPARQPTRMCEHQRQTAIDQASMVNHDSLSASAGANVSSLCRPTVSPHKTSVPAVLENRKIDYALDRITLRNRQLQIAANTMHRNGIPPATSGLNADHWLPETAWNGPRQGGWHGKQQV